MSNFLLDKSLVNIHCSEIDSLVVKDAPFMVRMFVARPNHELWRNNPSSSEGFSVALHPHHCDVTLIPVTGEIYNVTMGSGGDWHSLKWLRPYRYISHIINPAHAGFSPLCAQKVPVSLGLNRITGPLFMAAESLHTVYVPRYKAAAWWVIEGKENPSHDSVVWSNADLSAFEFSNLNLPMIEERLREDLALIGIGGF